MSGRSPFQRHIALPTDHGSWAFFLGPLLIGLFAGGRMNVATVYLTVAATCGFLMRQPITVAIKVWSGRRSASLLPAAWFWIGAYGAVAALQVAGLVSRGFNYLLYLAIPAVPVFAWYLFLVSRRAERRQRLMEILAVGTIALVAPAGMWVGLGHADNRGWILWLLVWSQLIAAVLYVYMRLDQRRLKASPATEQRLAMGAPALGFATGCVAVVAVAGALGRLPQLLFLPYAVQWVEVLWGVLRPAVGVRPQAIGLRQLMASVLFTALFIVLWTNWSPT